MAGKTALVTGASSGIGRAVAVDLAASGYTVYAAARRMELLQELQSDLIRPLRLDVTDPASIAAMVEHITAESGRLDVLVNNAGYGIYGSVEGAPPGEVEKGFAVNVFGLGRVTRALLPLMRAQGSGTVINISSVVGKVSMPFLSWYAASKHAVEGLSDGLRKEVAPFGIKVILVEPGSINTGFEDVAMETLANSEEPEAYHAMRDTFARLVRKSYENAPGPEVVSATVHKALSARHPRTRYRSGRDAKLFLTLRSLFSDRMIDRVIRGQFR